MKKLLLKETKLELVTMKNKARIFGRQAVTDVKFFVQISQELIHLLHFSSIHNGLFKIILNLV